MASARASYSCKGGASSRVGNGYGDLASCSADEAVIGRQLFRRCSCSTRLDRSLAGRTDSDGIKAASAALPSGMSRAEALCSAAQAAMAMVPRMGRKLPSRPSSPAHHSPSRMGRSSWPLAARRASAIGRSKAGPSFLRSAGARLTTTRTNGPRKPLLRRAEAPARGILEWPCLAIRPVARLEGLGRGPPPR